MAEDEPQPCPRFKRMLVTKNFLRHLPNCSSCKAVIAYLERESNIHAWIHKHRN
jgi:hypothetical protein